MAATYSNAALTTISGGTGGIPSTLIPRPVPQWTDRVKNRNVPLLSMITKAAPPERTHNVLTWGFSSPRENVDRLAEALDTTETGVDVDNPSYHAIGDVIQIESEKMLITGISGSTLTVIRAYNGDFTTGSTHTDDYGILNLGPAYRQNQDTELTPIAQGELLTNNWQQMEFKLKSSHMREIFPSFETMDSKSALQHFLNKLMDIEALSKLELTLIHGEDVAESATNASTMAGVLDSAYTSNVDTVSGALTANQLMDSIQDTFLASHQGVDLTLMTHPSMVRRISSFFAGMRRMDATDEKVRLHVEELITPWGNLKLVANNNWIKPAAAAATGSTELDKILIFNPKDVELVPASKDSVWHISIESEPTTSSWSKIGYLRGAYSVRMKNPYTRTIISGYSVTDSDYPGMI